MVAGWAGTCVGMFTFLTVPLEAQPRAFEPRTLLGELLRLEQADIDLPAGIVLFGIAFRIDSVWSVARNAAERIANAWRECRVGPFRILNHGCYAGLASACGVLLAGTLLGGEGLIWLAVVLVAAGIAISCLPVPRAAYPAAGWDWGVFVAAVVIGGVHVLAMGVDLPNSDQRFSRLV